MQEKGNWSSAGTTTITLDAAATAGNLLVAVVGSNNGNALSISGFTAATSSAPTAVGQLVVFKKTAAGGETSISAVGANTFMDLLVMEFTALAGGHVLEASETQYTPAGGSTKNFAGVSTAGAAVLVAAIVADNPISTVTFDTGYTLADRSVTSNQIAVGRKVVAAGGGPWSTTAAMSSNAFRTYISVLDAFK